MANVSNEETVAHFNAIAPVGTEVTVVKDDGREVLTEVTRPAMVLGGHTPVVWLKGISGAYLLDRVIVG